MFWLEIKLEKQMLKVSLFNYYRLCLNQFTTIIKPEI
jgi:hypothetical protein